MIQTHLPVEVLYSKQLINKSVINNVISNWPSYRPRLAVLASGQYR